MGGADAVWVELKTEDGRTYFWNRKENTRAWVLPEGVTVKWVGQKSPDGRTYYWSRGTKETVWVLPPLDAQAEDGKAVATSAATNSASADADKEARPEEKAHAEKALTPAAEEVTKKAAVQEPDAVPSVPPSIEPAGPRGNSASSVAARHVISASGCDSWFSLLPNGEWEEVIRYWPPPEDLVVRAPKLKKPKPDPYGIRELILRCQRHEEMVQALLAAQYGSSMRFTSVKYPTPKASEWCFWTADGKQLVVDASTPQDFEAPPGKQGDHSKPIIRRSPPENDKWRLIRTNLRAAYSMVFKARKLQRLERMIRKNDKVAVQALLDEFGADVPESLNVQAQKLLAPPPPKQPPPAKQPPPMPIGVASEQAAALGGVAGAPIQQQPILQQMPQSMPPLGFSQPAGMQPAGMGVPSGIPPPPPMGPSGIAHTGGCPMIGVSQAQPQGTSLQTPFGLQQTGPALGQSQASLGQVPSPPGQPGFNQLSTGPASPPPPVGPPPISQAGTAIPKGLSSPGAGPPPAMSLPEQKDGHGQKQDGWGKSASPSWAKSSSFQPTMPGAAPAVPFAKSASFVPSGGPAPTGPPGNSGASVDTFAVPFEKSASFAKAQAPPSAPALGSAPGCAGSQFSPTGAGNASPNGGFAMKQQPVLPPPGLQPPPGLPPPPGMQQSAVAAAPGALAPPPLAGGLAPGATSCATASAASSALASTSQGGTGGTTAALVSGMPPHGACQASAPVTQAGAAAGGAGSGTPPPTKAPPPAWKAAPPGWKPEDAPAQAPPTKAPPPQASPAVAAEGSAHSPQVAGQPQTMQQPLPQQPPLQPQQQVAATASAAIPAPVVPAAAPGAPTAAVAAPAPGAPAIAAPAAGVPATGPPAAGASAAVASATAAGGDEAAPWASRKRRRGAAATTDKPVVPAQGTSTPVAAQPVREQKPGAADRAAAERIAAAAERLVAATGNAAAAVGAARAEGTGLATNAATEERLKRTVVVSNIPTPPKATELADFFTGAIFSATGHVLAAQWQSGEASKVVVGVDLVPGTALGSASAEVTFGTPTAANVAVALHGIQFKGKALEIRRLKGVSAPAKRPTLQGVSIKDLVAGGSIGDAEERAQSKAPVSATASATGTSNEGVGAVVSLSGIPTSMSSKSVYDLLQQFGGPLKSLNLAQKPGMGEHLGHGMAEYVDVTSAREAVSFSPLLGFIEVSLGKAKTGDEAEAQSGGVGAGAKRPRRSRFDADDGAGPTEGMDLGPFEAVLPPAKKAPSEDLGPFEAVLGSLSVAAPAPLVTPRAGDDLGPFEAVLPPSKAPPMDDLGPFADVVPKRSQDDDLGPFADAVRDFTQQGN
eukprot:TRINITY_DN31386_c0_g1_i1.p1 TRINITY_DN31386_c0_g1~~TRINITY_DN31386_c0_g1_i1.p1  ORF type:complete len:1357 (-),score=281.14 TRINITY_DN31386_c0_g1_i1:135-4136(-)